ncbi:MAG TPA: hypothetical protein VNN10_04670 [Dehalococcoidia bacterium]|nr:hypothetical protein [Dehalococcoidia bacterium]
MNQPSHLYETYEPSQVSGPTPSAQPQQVDLFAKGTGLWWQIIGSAAASLVALVFIPLLMGAVAVALGGYVFFGQQRLEGQKPLGFALMVGGVAAAAWGVLLGMAASGY